VKDRGRAVLFRSSPASHADIDSQIKLVSPNPGAAFGIQNTYMINMALDVSFWERLLLRVWLPGRELHCLDREKLLRAYASAEIYFFFSLSFFIFFREKKS
jgi:hypothetical protein